MLSRSFNYNKLIYVSSLVRFVFIDNDGSSVFWPQTGKKVNQLCFFFQLYRTRYRVCSLNAVILLSKKAIIVHVKRNVSTS